LIVAEPLYTYNFLTELCELIVHIGQLLKIAFMLGVLGLIVITMMANLWIPVVIGSYATFVSKLNLDGCADRLGWLSHVDPGTIKVKLAALLIGISSVHLLKFFVDVTN
jgi:uncharacterized protein (TIGR00645 family)